MHVTTVVLGEEAVIFQNITKSINEKDTFQRYGTTVCPEDFFDSAQLLLLLELKKQEKQIVTESQVFQSEHYGMGRELL